MKNNINMKLKELRELKKLTQKKVADDLNIPYSNYNKYELNKVTIDIDTLIKIADYYDVTLDYLCERKCNNGIGFITNEAKPTIRKLIALSLNFLIICLIPF